MSQAKQMNTQSLSPAKAKPTAKSVKLTVYIPEDLFNSLRQQVYLENSTRSAIVSQILCNHYEHAKFAVA
jgi:hypothetical protein